MSSNRTIAKNTIFLYFRMMLIILITLYTSRIILQALGVNDYGLYAVVGSVVGMLSFLNNAFSLSTSRFLTFELGTGDFEKLRKTFSTLLSLHIIIAIAIVILAETLGLWFVYNKLAIPSERLNAAVWAYHISILTSVVSITQVPYNASIISHERMKVFAYASIAEVSAKLGMVFLLQASNTDKLVLYAVLVCMVQVGMALFYRLYCISRFKETHYKFIIDRNIMKSVGSFSGWTLLSQMSIALNSQGTNVITSIFFSPAVVAARVISEQVNMAVSQFGQNFRIAVNPQIVKRYAAEDNENSKKLLLYSAKFSFYLMFLLGLPIILVAEPLLQLWLGQVPEYSVVFLQLIIVQNLFSVFDTSFYVALYAKGRLRENAFISPILIFTRFPITYFLFKAGFSPVVLSYAGIILWALLGLLVKPILVCKIMDYTFRDIMSVFIPCLKVCALATPIPLILSYCLSNGLFNFFLLIIVSVVSTLTTVFLVGVDVDMRRKVVNFLRNKIARRG